MPPKKKTAPPIDRPLSKAYLREFKGWSTAYPPGLSDPNSLRLMENVQITREGAAAVRPGLRSHMMTKMSLPIVGSHELFYTATGGKAYLVAVRDEANNKVDFRVISREDSAGEPGEIREMTLEEAGFYVYSANSVEFSLSTTYVRYLQIDNKIFALSNSPEPMCMFWVGETKEAKKLQEVSRPEWTTEDKPIVRHPDENWITDNDPIKTRHNRVNNPEFASLSSWDAGSRYSNEGSSDYDYLWIADVNLFGSEYPPGLTGGIRSLPERTNRVPNPLTDVATYGVVGWEKWTNTTTLEVVGDVMRWGGTPPASNPEHSIRVRSGLTPVRPGKVMRFRWDHVEESDTAKGWGASVMWFKSNGDQIGSEVWLKHIQVFHNGPRGRANSGDFTVPDQAAYARIGLKLYSVGYVYATFDTKNVWFGEVGESDAAFSGDDGQYYFWLGDPGNSISVYHPPQDVSYDQWSSPISPNINVFGAATVYADPAKSPGDRTAEVILRIADKDWNIVARGVGSAVVPADGTGVRIEAPITASPSNATRAELILMIKGAEKDEHFHWNAAHLEQASSSQEYFWGNKPDTELEKYSWGGTANNSWSHNKVYAGGQTTPPAETPTDKTLVAGNSDLNKYTFGFFYTIGNDVGESAESQITVVRCQRAWTGWKWETPNSKGEPSGTETDDPLLCADQLVLAMPQDVFDAAMASSATHWNAYFYTHGPNDPPPVTAIKFAEIPLKESSTYGADGKARLTPELTSIGNTDPVIPTEETRFNSTDPSRGSQGLVASDRLILVGDPDDPARISWSSGQPGDYHDFSPALGGGTKQLTTGNLFIASCVKLWQNPQSVDTLTILTRGDDGKSNAHYMQPATITSLSETVNIMGFEETTGMEGTMSPYGCEVVNNALYHPLDHMLVKSTANNYNIAHKTQTEDIQNMWRALQTKHKIVTATLDNRIYYLVHNIIGDTLEPYCNGNEIWVMDTQSKTQTWSRWKLQGVSLRSIEIDNKVMMGVVRPEGLFALDPERSTDEYFDEAGALQQRNIGWLMETNTQGANRAHDAWASLQQANVMMGNFAGQLEYGIRGHDAHGMVVEVVKQVIGENPPEDGTPTNPETGDIATSLIPWDREDYMLVRKTLKEWFFFARSIHDEVTYDEDTEDERTVQIPRYSTGQINAVQYRYTPITVNVGYEYGSVETFEYGSMREADATTDSGVPKPYIDMGRP